MEPIRAKKHRLPDAAYRGEKNVAFTANVNERHPLFNDANVIEALLPILEGQTERCGCLVGIYCFMPDHLHLVLCGQTPASDAKKAMDGFKHKSGLWLEEHRPLYGWQHDYHDHIIRKGDDWRRHVFYAYMNPVRAGLVDDPADWRHTGSLGFDLIELLTDASW